MSMATFCASGRAERVKGVVHGAAGTIIGIMAVYNAVAWWHRRERHLGVNAVVYTAGLALEVYQTSRHLRRCTETPNETASIARGDGVAAHHESDAEPCACGDGFCWCGGAESQVSGFAEALRRAGLEAIPAG